MLRKLFKVVRLVSIVGAVAAAVNAVRQGASRKPAAQPTSVDTWPEVPRRD